MTAHTTSPRWGLAVIGLVVLAAVVTPNLCTKIVSGTGQVAPVPGPPAVGDCVTEPIDPSFDQPTAVHAASGAITVTYAYPQVALGP